MKQLSLLVLMSLFLPTVVLGAYNDVSLTTGTTLQVTVGGTALGLTVTNGTVEKVVVEGSTLGITLAGGSSIDLTSADKYTFSYAKSNAIVGETCGSSSSSLGISLAAGQTTETVSVSPTTTICQTSASGSGSSSSSSDSSSSSSSSSSSTSSSSSSASTPSTTTTTSTTASTPAATTASVPAKVAVAPPVVTAVSAPSASVSYAPSVMVNSELNPGARNDEVMDLQKLLAKDPEIYPEGTVSGFYGPKTTAAVKKFQAKYGLPTVGRVGPATMAKLNEVLGSQTSSTVTSTTDQTAEQIQNQIQTIQAQIQGITSGGSVSGVSVNSELNPGARNGEVMDLQKLLAKDPEIYPEGTVSGFYGPKTTAAVKKFQAKYGLPTVGKSSLATIAKLNEVLGVSVAMPTVPEAPSYTAPTVNSSTDATKQIEDQIKAIQDQIKVLTAPVAAPVKPVASPSVVPSTTSSSDIAKQVEDQIKAIQAQIDALLKQ